MEVGSSWRLDLWSSLLPAPWMPQTPILCDMVWELSHLCMFFASDEDGEVDTVKLGVENRAFEIWCSLEMSVVINLGIRDQSL